MPFNWAALLGTVTGLAIEEAGIFVKSPSGQTLVTAETPIAVDIINALAAQMQNTSAPQTNATGGVAAQAPAQTSTASAPAAAQPVAEQAQPAVPAAAMVEAMQHLTAGQRALELLTFGAVKPHPAVVAAQAALTTAMAHAASVATQS